MAKKKKSTVKAQSRKPKLGKPKAGKKVKPHAAGGTRKKVVAKAKKAVAKPKKTAAKPVKRKTATPKAIRKPKPAVKKKAAPLKKAANLKKAVTAKAKPVTAAKTAIKPPGRVQAPAPQAKAKPAKSPLQAPTSVASPAPAKHATTPKPSAAPSPEPKAVEAPKAVEKKPLKERVTMEFQVNSAPNVLYELISTPSGFSEWYCDDVNVRGDQFTFMWNGEEEPTTMIGRKLGEVIRFHRNDDEDEAAFFEFRIRIDAMTNEVALIVTDHAWPQEVEDTRNLWASQIANLVRVLGA